jgi:putative membrane protein
VSDPTSSPVGDPVSDPVINSASDPAPASPASAVRPPTGLADGEWHRLHPATPLLRGGIALIVILSYVVSNLRERLINMFIGGGSDDGDPIDWVVREGYVGIALAIIALGLLIFISGFYVSWRMHTFRITNEVVEVRSGILFRTNRRGRLDRIQGIDIVRPFFARLFGAAKLEVNVAGHDARVQLAYLSSPHADALRRDILRLASGTRRQPDVATAVSSPTSFIDQRVSEIFAPELDPDLAPPESVVKMHVGRLLASILTSDTALVFYFVIGASIVGATLAGSPLVLIGIFPIILGLGSFIANRFTKALRYTIAGTPDGIRVGFGLFTTSNETLPPGRIHSVQVSQPLLWRPAGWWEMRVNRASKSSQKAADGQKNTTILPIGNLEDVMKVLALMLPGLVDEQSAALLRRGLLSRGGNDGFVNSPRRAAVFRWFSWRRNGFAFAPGVVMFRKGFIWRQLVVVPQPRVQSVALHQGPIDRSLGLATVHLHTVTGPITARLGGVDRDVALEFFTTASRLVVESASADTSHRWRSGEVTA